ncbi:MAG TPA: cupin domain-containing protein, partial [Brevundimonas sp.]
HCEGEKVWRLYQNRAENPVNFAPEQTPARLERTRGALMQEVRMRPGDVLYLPRGWYHDALAQADASLHVTFSVTPLYGRAIFSLLENAALQDPAFRAWLPPAHHDGGRALQSHLADLGRRLSALAADPQFADDLAMTQERLMQPVGRYGLPTRKMLTRYRRTNLIPPSFMGPVAIAMNWAFSQADFAVEDLCALFDFIDDDTILKAVQTATSAGALVRT